MKKVYNCLFYASFIMAIFSVYCKILVSYFDILLKADRTVICLFFAGLLGAVLIAILLHYLFRQKKA